MAQATGPCSVAERLIGRENCEEWLGMLLLAGLPESYKPMVMALQNSGEAITGDLIKTKLLQEEHEPAENASDPAFAISRPGNKQDHHGNRAKSPKCHACQKYGHIARNCPEKTSSTMSPNKERSKPGRAFGAVLTTGNDSKPEDWFFDSGASRHLTRTKSLLHDVQRANGKMVAANKEGMQVVAKGTAVINTTCGEEINVTDVQLIPGLAANLLSVSKIVDKGYTVVFRRNGCEVLDEEGVCVATGSRSDGLFKLEQEKLRVLACRSRQRRRRRASNGSPCTVVNLDYEDGTKEVAEVSVVCSNEDAEDSVTLPALPPRTPFNPPVSPEWLRSGRERVSSGKYNQFANMCSGQRSPRVSGGQNSDGPSTPVVLRVASSSRRPVDGSFQYPTHDDPNVHKAALTQDISNGWRRAMQEEYNAHRTWGMTNLQGGVYGPVLGCGSPGLYRHPTSFYEGHVGMCRCRCDLHQG